VSIDKRFTIFIKQSCRTSTHTQATSEALISISLYFYFTLTRNSLHLSFTSTTWYKRQQNSTVYSHFRSYFIHNYL